MKEERAINIRLIRSEELPESIGGCVSKLDGNDNYLMLINGAKSERRQIVSFLHECLHIWRRDHERTDPVTVIEQEIHEELREILKEMQNCNL